MACGIRHGATPRAAWKISASAISRVPAMRPPKTIALTTCDGEPIQDSYGAAMMS
jgi:hypothetical protein